MYEKYSLLSMTLRKKYSLVSMDYTFNLTYFYHLFDISNMFMLLI
jgi:hypothetical protein